MSRFKFRAWHKKYEAMIRPEEFQYLATGHELAMTPKRSTSFRPEPIPINLEFSRLYLRNREGYYDWIFDRKDLIIMQYTGVRDSDGREIYEGDIFETTLLNRGIVKWKDDRFVLEYIVNPDFIPRISQVEGYVVGNKYESPHLIPKKVS